MKPQSGAKTITEKKKKKQSTKKRKKSKKPPSKACFKDESDDSDIYHVNDVFDSDFYTDNSESDAGLTGRIESRQITQKFFTCFGVLQMTKKCMSLNRVCKLKKIVRQTMSTLLISQQPSIDTTCDVQKDEQSLTFLNWLVLIFFSKS